MEPRELQYLIFELLHERLTMPDPPMAFVGVRGDDIIVVMQPNGEHLGVLVVPVKASVGA